MPPLHTPTRLLQVTPQPERAAADGGVEVIVASCWVDTATYEAWRNGRTAAEAGAAQHLPSGIYQYVPRRGEGFPEDFVPFRDYDEPVSAKYK